MKKAQTLEQWCEIDPRPVYEQAQFLGLSEPQYWRWRKGMGSRKETAMRIESLTGVPASELLGLEQPKRRAKA